jgi:GNAT superfamily N-acetyltransferase
MARNARVAGGGTHTTQGLAWIYTPGEHAEVTVPFPRLGARTAGQQLDAIIGQCYTLAGLGAISCWSLLEQTTPADLGARLLARGFEWGWRPYWMWLDLRRWAVAPAMPRGLRTGLVADEANSQAYDLPYHSAGDAHQLEALARMRPRRVWHFGSWIGKRLVGHSVLNLTTGRLGVAGIFSVGVAPEHRGRGIAKAIMAEALRFAQETGCRYAVLNSTEIGEPLYRSLGFLPLGYGQTWWLHRDVLALGPPSDEEVVFAEAIGRGDLPALESLAHRPDPILLNATLRCGLTPVQLAVQTKQPGSAEWLTQHGATLDVVSAWDLDWKERARDLLSTSPEVANLTPGKAGRTALHEAVMRNDMQLAHLVLDTKPDLEIEDAMFHSTPLGWARHLGQQEMLRLLEREMERRQ